MLDSTLALPNIAADQFRLPGTAHFAHIGRSAHAPRILLLYGSVRQRSYSRLLAEEAARLLNAMGAETRFFNPSGLPLPDDAADSHPKVRELRELTQWSEGMVWSSPERHGAMTGIMKAQIDWIPLSLGSVRPTQGKTLAVMQVSGGSQSFNAVSQMRILGRWMRLITIPNQSSVAKAYQEFDEKGRMKQSAFYDRVVDVMEELVKFTLLTRDISGHLVDRYSERKERAKAEARPTRTALERAPSAPQACCGGRPRTNAEACCARDEKAKAAGQMGCGCSPPQLLEARERCCA
jgi:arsenical resistance protein ArsH